MNWYLVALGLPVLVVGALATIEAAIRNSMVGVALVLSVTVYSFVAPTSVIVNVSGTNVGFQDIVVSLLLCATVARLLRSQGISGLQVVVLLFGALALISVLRGAVEFGPNTSINEFRKFFNFFTGVLYFSTVPWRSDVFDRMGTVWVKFALFLVGLAVIRWIAGPLGLTGGIFGTAEDLRVLNAEQTVFIAQALFICVVAWLGEINSLLRRAAPVFLSVVLILQHRTVWVLTIVCLAVAVSRERALRARVIGLLAVAVLVVSVLSLTVLDDDASPLAEELSNSATNSGTFEWRYEGWRALLRDSGPTGPVDVLIGKPFGGGWERSFSGLVVDVSPHNFYVETYMRTGLLGLFLLGALYVAPLISLARARRRDGILAPRTLSIIALSFLIYAIPYTPNLPQALLTGLVVAAASGVARERRTITVRPDDLVRR